jgi:hypothetical protein
MYGSVTLEGVIHGNSVCKLGLSVSNGYSTVTLGLSIILSRTD